MSAKPDDHILLSVLIPAARLAVRMGLPLSELKQTAELAYYREARSRGLKMREIAETMSVSMAKVGALSKSLKEHFSEPEREYGVPRRVLSLLWVGPLSLKRIQQALPDIAPSVVKEAASALVRDERLMISAGRTPRYELTSLAHRLLDDGWMARIDALGHMMLTAAHVVEGRFEKNDDRAFTRSLGFRALPGALKTLEQTYKDEIFPMIAAADAEATDHPDADQFALTFQFTPDFDVDR
ncbi:MAG: hypothetical protein ACJAYU_003777 [Bradymonadia bacterium]